MEGGRQTTVEGLDKRWWWRKATDGGGGRQPTVVVVVVVSTDGGGEVVPTEARWDGGNRGEVRWCQPR